MANPMTDRMAAMGETESLSAPVEDEEKVLLIAQEDAAKAIEHLALLASHAAMGMRNKPCRDRRDEDDYERIAQKFDGEKNCLKQAADTIRALKPRLRAPVGVTVGEPALTRLEVEGWRPIETAPKDGTDLLMFGRVHDSTGRPYSPDANIGWWDKGSEEWAIRDLHGRIEPTHWMPLPAPPALQANGVSGSPSSPKQTSELEEAEAIGCGSLK